MRIILKMIYHVAAEVDKYNTDDVTRCLCCKYITVTQQLLPNKAAADLVPIHVASTYLLLNKAAADLVLVLCLEMFFNCTTCGSACDSDCANNCVLMSVVITDW